MKQYNLKSNKKLHKIGQVTFTYDKPINTFNNRLKYSKFAPTTIKTYIMSNETPEQTIEFLKRNFNNARDFTYILFNEAEKIIENRI